MTHEQRNAGFVARDFARHVQTVGAIGLYCASLAALAGSGGAGQSVNVSPGPTERAVPATNTAVTNARVLIPDGTSVSQAIGPLETRWFAFEVEPGKTYVVEALDPNGDIGANTVGAMSITAADGVSLPPDTSVDCVGSVATLPPGLSVTNNGKRCTVYVKAPDDTTLNRRGVYVGIGQGAGAGVNVRVRESSLYGRWTTNSYDFHLELDNTTSTPVCVRALFYRDTGYTFNGTDWGDAPGNLSFQDLNIPSNGALKIVIPNGTPVGGTLRGPLRIVGCPTIGNNFVPGSVHVSAFGFNPVTKQFYYLYIWQGQNGWGANSW